MTRTRGIPFMNFPTRAFTAIATTTIVLTIAGCSAKSTTPAAGPAGRTIDITMADNTFQPTQIKVTKGETVALTFRNTGSARHEAILGNDATQMEHHAAMTKPPGQMEHGNSAVGAGSSKSDDAITVEPGQSGTITRTFNESGPVMIGCHEPGHWESGMKATVTVG